MTDKKWTLNINTEFNKEEINPQIVLKNNSDENNEFEICVSKDKIFASYEVKF